MLQHIVRRLPHDHNFAVQIFRDNAWVFINDFDSKAGGYVCIYSEEIAYQLYKNVIGQHTMCRLVKVSTYLPTGAEFPALTEVLEFNITRSK